MFMIRFPSPIIWISGVLLATMIPLPLIEVYRRKKGNHNGKTGIGSLVTEGPFRVVRHPEYIGEMGFLLLLTVVLSPIFPFTLVSILSNILVVFAFSILAIKEEKINTQKWGEEYRRYMEEVPRFNFIKGMFNLMRKRR
jgi:protein-S-isoprenylcysteine O-methyltransferase Ste14